MCRWSHVGLQSKRHWQLDLTYRVQHDLPVFNRLMDPMELSETQVADFVGRPSKGLAEGFSFPEDLPACTRVDSSVPLMTMINSVLELFRCGGSYTLLRKLWGSFRATLGPEEPLFSLKWDRAETLVRCFMHFITFVYACVHGSVVVVGAFIPIALKIL